MKKFLLASLLVIMTVSLIACAGRNALIGKWSADRESYNLLENEELIFEFTTEGTLITDRLLNGVSQESYSTYYKIVQSDTFLMCVTKDSCDESGAPYHFTISDSVLTIIDLEPSGKPMRLNRLP